VLIGTALAARVILLRSNLVMAGGNPILGVTATLLLVLSVGVVTVGTARFAHALTLPPRPMPAAATGE
jgi:hypothetical protein